MLEASGFTVHDLGSNVPVRQFVDRAEEHNADIIAASAILTTTMAYMPDLVKLVGETGPRGRFKVLLGGAPVTPEFAAKAGADGYGENAARAVQVARDLAGARKGGK
jgi:methanogenic corrinoid protein MtbC1